MQIVECSELRTAFGVNIHVDLAPFTPPAGSSTRPVVDLPIELLSHHIYFRRGKHRIQSQISVLIEERDLILTEYIVFHSRFLHHLFVTLFRPMSTAVPAQVQR